MARRFKIGKRATYLVAGIVLVLVLGNFLAPSLVSAIVGSSGRSFSFFRAGIVEQHKTNLTGHWLGTAKGTSNSGLVLAGAGEQVVVRYRVEVDEGRVLLRLRHYDWSLLPDTVWSRSFSDDRTGIVSIDIPASGVYRLGLSYFSFAGSVVMDWEID